MYILFFSKKFVIYDSVFKFNKIVNNLMVKVIVVYLNDVIYLFDVPFSGLILMSGFNKTVSKSNIVHMP